MSASPSPKSTDGAQHALIRPVAVVYCEGNFGKIDGKTANGLVRQSEIYAIASVIDSNDPDEIDRIISEGIPDPVGSFYRFSLASSQLRRKNKMQNAN